MQAKNYRVIRTALTETSSSLAAFPSRPVHWSLTDLQKLRIEAEALEYAKGTDYGLASSIWTSNIDTTVRMTAIH